MATKINIKQLDLPLPNDPNNDGIYGTTNAANLIPGDEYNVVIDKLVSTIDNLLPEPPSPLSSRNIINSTSNAYSARVADSSSQPSGQLTVFNTLVNNVFDVTDVNDFPMDFNVNGQFGSTTGGTLQFTMVLQSGTYDMLSTPFQLQKDSSNDGNRPGDYGTLIIAAENDPYLGIAGQGIYKQADASVSITDTDNPITLSDLNNGPKTAQFIHSTTGSTPISGDGTFYIEDKATLGTLVPADITITTAPETPNTPTYSYDVTASSGGEILFRGEPYLLSGVPVFSDNGGVVQVEAGVTVSNAVGYFFNSTRISRLNSPTGTFQSDNSVDDGTNVDTPETFEDYSHTHISIVNQVYQLGSNTARFTAWQPNPNSNVSVDVALNAHVDTISRVENTVRVISGYNIAGPDAFSDLGNNLYETGDLYNSDELLNANGIIDYSAAPPYAAPVASADSPMYAYELQFINNKFIYPSADYSVYTPIGPDYSTGVNANNSAPSNYRYATFKFNSAVNPNTTVNNIRIQLTSFENANATINPRIIDDLEVYVRFDNSTFPSRSTGWLNANSLYGGGIPVNDDDPALDAGNTSFISGASIQNVDRGITFGTVGRSGDLYVKVGIPVGSNYAFSGVSII